jgi:hypothetical protein
MKYVLLLLLFYISLQAQPNERIDSTTYYSNLSKTEIQSNNYKEALFNSQKLSVCCKKQKILKTKHKTLPLKNLFRFKKIR